MPKNYDVVIIGGGIHGVGVAQAAAAAGYSCLLLEKTALAAGTSSKSSKLIHGGLRYLESAQIHLVYESLHERAILLRVAPDLVRLTPFHIPVYRSTRRRPWMVAAGLTLYAALGGFAEANRFSALARDEWGALDGLATQDLQRVFRYYDAQTDDTVLTNAVMRSAQSLGAELCCPARFIGATITATGFHVEYRESASERSCEARVIVNAAGPWANEALDLVTPNVSTRPFELVQGAHIELDAPAKRGIYYCEAVDGRAVFVMPWHGHTLVGTTETRASVDPDHVTPKADEIRYLHETFSHHFPGERANILSSFAGARVLPGGDETPFHRSRETILHLDEARAPGLLTIYGGKLTGYRAAAEKVMRRVSRYLPSRPRRANTASLPLTPVT